MNVAVSAEPAGTVAGGEAEVGAALDGITAARLRIVAPVLLGVIMLFDSWDSIAIAYVMPALAKEWALGPVAAGSLMSAGYGGQFVGALALGSVAERYGRMPVFLGAVTFMSALAILCALAPGFELLFAVRLVQGIAIGGALPVAITYINEIAPSQSRGRYFAFYQTIAMAGYGVASVASVWIVPQLGWRWMFAAGAIPLVLLPLVVMLLPESPRWLVKTGRVDAALAALRKLGDRTTTRLSAPVAVSLAPGRRERLPMATLFRAPFRTRTFVVMAIWFATYFANFGLVTWVPSIYVSVFRVPIETALKYGAYSTVIYTVTMPVIGMLIDKVGRRPIAIVGTGGATFALLWLGLLPPAGVLAVVLLVLAGKFFISTGATIVWPYTAEVYPTRVRAAALGLNSSVARAASTLTPMVVGGILGAGASVGIVFGLFGICAGIAFLLWTLATRETRATNLDEE